MTSNATEIAFRGDLSKLDLDTEYRSTKNDPVETFYKKCLRNADLYQRAVGYFRSSVLLIIGRTLLEFARRGGRIQLICSPSLSEEDVRSISGGYARRDKVLASAVIEEFDRLLAEPSTAFPAKALATLISCGALEVRLAQLISGNGIYHEKIGLFTDCFGHTVSFRGSTNETWSGWHAEGNFEAIEVFCDWDGPSDRIRIDKHRNHFATLWSGKDPSVTVSAFPETAEIYLRKYAANSIEEIMESVPVTPTSRRQPLPHQTEALQAWRRQGCRGIFEHATGTGKTFTAIVAIRDHVRTGKPALVLVPSRLLLHQWAEEISDEIPDAALMLAGDGQNRWKLHGRLKSMTAADLELGPRVV